MSFDICMMKNPKVTYEVSVRDDKTTEVYSSISLDLDNAENCKMIVLSNYLDDKSVIAVDNKRYVVTRTQKTHNCIIVYVIPFYYII